MKEIWKDIEGYEGLYQVSTHGRVLRLPYNVKQWNGTCMCTRHFGERILQDSDRRGYRKVHLFDGVKRIAYGVHCLVAKAFLPNPNNLPCINHIDEDKTNNRLDNLEWVSYKQNCNYGTRNYRISLANIRIGRSRGVIQMTLNGKELARYESIMQASRITGIDRRLIQYVCKGKRYTTGGYRFAFSDT